MKLLLQKLFKSSRNDENSVFCPVCGLEKPTEAKEVLWPELISAWELTPDWVEAMNLREGTTCTACGASQRSVNLAQAIMAVLTTKMAFNNKATSLDKLTEDPRAKTLRIAEINAAGDLHPFLAKFPLLKFSEHGSTDPKTRAENLLELTYLDNSFDLIVTSDTLNYVPDLEAALAEIRRVLKPGGYHVFTIPVIWDRPATRQRAKLQDNGKIQHILPASYFGSNASDKTESSLICYEFGADIVKRVRQSNFHVELFKDPSTANANPSLVSFMTRKAV